jgi:hypothetical protein
MAADCALEPRSVVAASVIKIYKLFDKSDLKN